MDCLKTDNFELFRAIVDPLDPLDREEVLQMYKKAYHYLKTGNPNTPPTKLSPERMEARTGIEPMSTDLQSAA